MLWSALPKRLKLTGDSSQKTCVGDSLGVHLQAVQAAQQGLQYQYAHALAEMRALIEWGVGR